MAQQSQDTGQLAVDEIEKARQQAAGAILEPSPLSESIRFRVWDFKQLGYHISPSEQVALRFDSLRDTPLTLEIDWRLHRYGDHRLVSSGSTSINIESQATGSAPIRLPGDLKDGIYRLLVTVSSKESQGQSLRDVVVLDYRAPAPHPSLNARLTTLIDSNDPEGFIQLASGPLREYVETRRSLPQQPEGQDVVLIQAELWRDRFGSVERLAAFIRQGGHAIIFGKYPVELDEISPVQIDRQAPWDYTPRHLGSVAYWPAFEPKQGSRHYGTNVRAKADARTIVTWDDGTPAVVSRSHGEGQIVYFAMPPGRTWLPPSNRPPMDELLMRTVYSLLGRDDAGSAIDQVIAGQIAAKNSQRTDLAASIGGVPDDARVGISEENFARFGWHLVSETGIVDNLGFRGEVETAAFLPAERNSTTPEAILELRIPGMTSHQERLVKGTWLSRVIDWADQQGKARFRSTISTASPLTLFESDESEVSLTCVATHLIVMTEAGVRVLEPGDFIDGTVLSSNWVLTVNAREDHRDSPRLIALTRRPASLGFATNSIKFEFSRHRGMDVMAVGQLYGIRRFAPGETKGLIAEPPADWIKQADRLGRLALAIPVDADEMFWIEDDDVVVANRFIYRELDSDWPIKPLYIAPIPPFVELNRQHGVPNQIDGEIIDLDIATKWGPYTAVSGDRLVYRLRLPWRDHYGVIPAVREDPLYEHIDQRLINPLRGEWRASGAINRPDRPNSNPVGDLDDYIPADRVPLFEAWHADLYKLWFCFPAIAGRPMYGDEARQVADGHHRRVYRDILNFYPHRTIIHHRREPSTLLDYPINFIWPTNWSGGRRYYVDQDESWTVIAYCWEMYSRYYGDWTTTKSNWNLIQWHAQYNKAQQDWAGMAASNLEEYFNLGHDCINAQYPGHLAYARMAGVVGDHESEQLGLYLAARTIQPTIARWFMKDYLQRITEDGDPWREWRWHATLSDQRIMGYETALDPDARRTLSHNSRHLDTSKGTATEFVLMYKQFVRDRLDEYQRELQTYEPEVTDWELGTENSMARLMVEWQRDQVLATALKTERANSGTNAWRSLMAPHNLALITNADNPLFLSEWAPAEYVSGAYHPDSRTVELVLNHVEAEPCMIRLYTQRRPALLSNNGVLSHDWTYDERDGWMLFSIPANQQSKIRIQLDHVRPANLHPYFPAGWQH
ncbi:MAG: hypothetical protein RIG82_00075 [Phycisphaeraceae bacterium]